MIALENSYVDKMSTFVFQYRFHLSLIYLDTMSFFRNSAIWIYLLSTTKLLSFHKFTWQTLELDADREKTVYVNTW